MKHYHHVTDEERFYIWNASREGVSQKKIAETLRRHPSTISREMKRNRMPRSVMYTHHWACEMVKWRKRRVADTKHRKVTGEISDMIEQLVKQYLSPEQVCGYLKEHHSISPEATSLCSRLTPDFFLFECKCAFSANFLLPRTAGHWFFV